MAERASKRTNERKTGRNVRVTKCDSGNNSPKRFHHTTLSQCNVIKIVLARFVNECDSTCMTTLHGYFFFILSLSLPLSLFHSFAGVSLLLASFDCFFSFSSHRLHCAFLFVVVFYCMPCSQLAWATVRTHIIWLNDNDKHSGWFILQTPISQNLPLMEISKKNRLLAS